MLPATVIKSLEDKMAALQGSFPPGYRIHVGGTAEESGKSLRSVAAGVPIAALVMLIVLMVQLQSVSRLLLVLSVAPFGLIGVAFGVGFVLGPAIGGMLGSIDSRLPFWAAAASSLANGCYGLMILPESLRLELRRPFDWRQQPARLAEAAALAPRAHGPRERLVPRNSRTTRCRRSSCSTRCTATIGRRRRSGCARGGGCHGGTGAGRARGADGQAAW